jgi:hypothetical protein
MWNDTRTNSKLLVFILLFSIGATIAFRAVLIANKVTFLHDEGIAYMAATCHQAEYSRTAFGPSPQPASTWKNLLRVDQKFCFGQISRDLGASDLHPPLYFWLLHLWSLLLGVDVWTGPVLNSMFAVLTTILLYRFSSELLHSRSEAVLVTFTHALNYDVIEISALAKQYDLLIFCTLLLVWFTVRCARLAAPSTRETTALLIVALAGGLTHYHFVIPVSACVLYLLAKLKNRDIKRFGTALASLTLGFGASFVIHPYLFSSFEKEIGVPGVFMFSVESFALRLMRVAASFSAFYYIIVLTLLLALWAVVRYRRKLGELVGHIRRVDLDGLYVPFFGVWIAGGVILLYLTSVSPLHRMSAKYLIMAWPFLSFLPVFILRFVRSRPTIVMYLYLFPLIFTVARPLQAHLFAGERQDPGKLFDSAEIIVVDNVTRGILPRIVWHMPDEKPVIAARQEILLSESATWMSYLDDTGVYVSEVSYVSTLAGQQSIVGSLEREGYDVILIEEGIWDAGTVFSVKRP